MGLTIMWSLLYSNQQDSNIGISTLILTLVYLFVVVAEKCDGGTTESLLLIVNGTIIASLIMSWCKWDGILHTIIFVDNKING